MWEKKLGVIRTWKDYTVGGKKREVKKFKVQKGEKMREKKKGLKEKATKKPF